MPQIPQIGDTAGKSYSSTLNNSRGSSGGDQQFTVDGTQKPAQLQVVSDKNAGAGAQTSLGQKDLIPLAIAVTKNQALAVETVKDIIDADLLTTAKLNGYTELAGELENLNSSLYIPADKLLGEIIEQENHNTMFINDKFYDLLREAATDADPDLREAIGNMLKAINFSQNKKEITSAISSNLKFLAEYFSPNKNLSENLSKLAERWTSGEVEKNFAGLRNQTAELLKNVSDSLLNDSHTQTLVPIVIHNISKYNMNSSMLREYFGQLLTQIPSYEMRNELSNAFEALYAKLTGNQNTSFTNYTINNEKNQVEISFFTKENDTFNLLSSYLHEKLTDEEYLNDTGLISLDYSDQITALHSGSKNGMEIIRSMLSGLFTDEQMTYMLESDLNRINSMQELVNYLNGFLEAMPDGEVRNALYEALDEAINVLAEDNPFENAEIAAEKTAETAEKQSSIRALTDFVSKNINHPALKSIDSFNASNLLQSMINAPGVMTPLAHYILPIQIEDTRAFGELWVDNDDEASEKRMGGEKHYHMFLTFDVDSIGRFETDIYANENTINVSLLHPAAFGKNIEAITKKITAVAAGAGYSVNRFETGVLKEPHNLSQIFPKLNERRAGLNVQA